jgi:hypothetical protein
MNPYFEEALRELEARLTAHEGNYDEWIGCPNGWGLSIIRTLAERVRLPDSLGFNAYSRAGGSMGASAGLYEVALLDCRVSAEVCFTGPILREPEGWLTPADVARKLREVYELPYQEDMP